MEYRLTKWIICIFPLITLHCSTQNSQEKQNPLPVRIIFETDMCTDVDDVGALATLHALADQKEAEILAIGYNEVYKDGAKALDAINTWYHRGTIPIGVYKKELHQPDESGYLSETAKFPNHMPLNPAENPSAVDVYISTLKAQPDSSVTIVSVGFLNNLHDLLRADPKLISKKVKELVIMGSLHDDQWNLVRHDLVKTSQEIFAEWPTPIVISQVGADIHTGKDLESTSPENPVRASYYHYFGERFDGRSSWDQMAILYAVRGLQYFDLNSEGAGRLKEGYPIKLQPGWRSYTVPKLSNSEYEGLINELMARPPTGE
ncbi:MAG: nucleoside hydrolase [Saprospiraceae bacterium]|nr:nucleoside hydrolase [Saprospiraceae bacterium]